MNKIEQLLDEQFVKELFKKEILPMYPSFVDVKDVKVKPYKKLIWDDSFHVVFGFDTTFVSEEENGSIERILPIFCSGHSHENRKNVYDSLKFLWKSGFDSGDLTIPRPLFFSEEFSSIFYRGVQGNTLYHYIREKDFVTIEKVVVKAAQWFSKLHSLPIDKAENFNPENSRIVTVVPGREYVLEAIGRHDESYVPLYKEAYEFFINQEETFLNSTKERWLVHGDAHPENIIRLSDEKVAVIDFTDLCLTDFARDIGCFLQQVEYMANRKIEEPEYSLKLQKLFLDNYFKNVKIKLDSGLKQRISNYYYWTALRSATFLLISSKSYPERTKGLLEDLGKNLGKLIPILR